MSEVKKGADVTTPKQELSSGAAERKAATKEVKELETKKRALHVSNWYEFSELTLKNACFFGILTKKNKQKGLKKIKQMRKDLKKEPTLSGQFSLYTECKS